MNDFLYHFNTLTSFLAKKNKKDLVAKHGNKASKSLKNHYCHFLRKTSEN